MSGQNVPQSTTEKLQSNNKGNQNASLKSPDVKKNKFACTDCDFSCSSLQNFKIHLQKTNHKTPEKGMPQECSSSSSSFPNSKIPLQKTNPKTPEKGKPQNMSTFNRPEIQRMNPPKIQRMNPTINNYPEMNYRMNTTINNYPEMNYRMDPPINNPEMNYRMNPTINNYPEIQRMNPPINNSEIQRMNPPINNPERNYRMNPPINNYPEDMPENVRRSIFVLKDYMYRTDREPLIGLEYVVEYRVQIKSNAVITKYFCEICELDTDLFPMVEHLAGFRHRKLYLAIEYPYVLKAPSSNKEDRSQFMRRMALEIEREEGTKMYKIDPAVRMESIMNSKIYGAKQLRRKTRWDAVENSQGRMRKALEYLESFEVDNDIEATTVTRLIEKLTADLKLYSVKLKEESLFPVRVARAKDVAMSLIHNVGREPMGMQNPVQQNPMLKMPPTFNRGPPGTEMPKTMYSAQKDRNAPYNTASQKDPSPEDIQFFKKLMALLDDLPQNNSPSDNLQINSKLLTLKSMMLEQKSGSETPQNTQKLMMQVASLAQGTKRPEKLSLHQQLMMLMSSQNAATVDNVLSNQKMMQVASVAQNAKSMENAQLNQNSMGQRAGLGQNSGNVSTNPLVPFNRNFQSQEYEQMGRSSLNAYQEQNMEIRSEYASTSQNYGDVGYDHSREGNYLSSHDNPSINQRDNISESTIYRQNEQACMPYADMSGESGMYRSEWDDPRYRNPSTQVADPMHVDYAREQAPYTRVRLSPSFPASGNERFQDADYDINMRREIGSQQMTQSSRPFDSSEFPDRDSNMQYMKRARLDMDHIPSHFSENYHPESRGMSTAGQRVQGKDSFTASAVLSDYSDNRASK